MTLGAAFGLRVKAYSNERRSRLATMRPRERHHHPGAVLALDRLHPAEAGQRHAGQHLVDLAVAAHEDVAAARAVDGPVLQHHRPRFGDADLRRRARHRQRYGLARRDRAGDVRVAGAFEALGDLGDLVMGVLRLGELGGLFERRLLGRDLVGLFERRLLGRDLVGLFERGFFERGLFGRRLVGLVEVALERRDLLVQLVDRMLQRLALVERGDIGARGPAAGGERADHAAEAGGEHDRSRQQRPALLPRLERPTRAQRRHCRRRRIGFELCDLRRLYRRWRRWVDFHLSGFRCRARRFRRHRLGGGRQRRRVDRRQIALAFALYFRRGGRCARLALAAGILVLAHG